MPGKRIINLELSAKFANMSFVCACFVVCIHSGRFLGPIVGVSVPFFFMASGYMLARHAVEKGWYWRELKKRVWSLLVPYLCWCLIPALLLLPFSLLADMQAGRSFGASVPIVSQPLQVFGLLPNEWPINTPLWYLRTLMLLVFLAPAINWIVDRTRWFWIGLLFGCELLFATGVLPMYWGFSLLPIVGVLYFSLGWILNVWGISRVCVGGGAWLVMVLPAVAGLVLLIYGGKFAVTLAIPLIMFAMLQVMPARRLPAWLLSGTFLIFVSHMMVLNLFQMVFRRVGFSLALEQIISWSGTIVVVLCANQLLRRKLPRLVAVLCGGR